MRARRLRAIYAHLAADAKPVALGTPMTGPRDVACLRKARSSVGTLKIAPKCSEGPFER